MAKLIVTMLPGGGAQVSVAMSIGGTVYQEALEGVGSLEMKATANASVAELGIVAGAIFWQTGDPATPSQEHPDGSQADSPRPN